MKRFKEFNITRGVNIIDAAIERWISVKFSSLDNRPVALAIIDTEGNIKPHLIRVCGEKDNFPVSNCYYFLGEYFDYFNNERCYAFVMKLELKSKYNYSKDNINIIKRRLEVE